MNPNHLCPWRSASSTRPKRQGRRRLATLLVCAVFAGLFSGCAWTQPPSKSDAIITAYTVSGATRKMDAGQLFLTETGLWAYLAGPGADKQSAVAPRAFVPGEVVGFLPQARPGAAHIYGVVHVASWGVMLQRLDSRPVANAPMRGELVPLYDPGQQRRWGLCRGSSADIAQNACIKAAGADVKWRLYRTDKGGRLQFSAPDPSSATLPIAGAGLLVDGRLLVHQAPNAGEESATWLAVPAHQPRSQRAPGAPLLAHARILLGQNCPDFDLAASLQPLEVMRGESARPADPIDIESAAIRTGADALVRCEKTGVEVDVPTLYRPLFSVADTSSQGIPYGAMRPLRAANQPRARAATILLGAALGTGSTLVADFYLEEALRAAPDTEASRRLALEFMQIFAASGRPELALRAGQRAARGAWHHENDPAFVLGRSWVFAAIGETRAQSDGMVRLAKLAKSPENAQLRQWLAWSTIRADATRTEGRSVRGAMSFFEGAGLVRWLDAANKVVGTGLQVDLDTAGESRPAPTELGRVFEVRSAAEGEDHCEEGCRLDVYGRNFAARLESVRHDTSGEALRRLIHDLSTTSVATLRPGFKATDADFRQIPAAAELALRAALMPLLEPAEREPRYDALVDAAARAVKADGACLKLPGAALLTRRLGGKINAKSPAHFSSPPILEATRWLISEAFEAACNSPADFARSLDQHLGHHHRLARRTIPVLMALSERTAPDTRAEMLRHVAEFSTRHKAGEDCVRLNLALAMSNIQAERLQSAAENLAESVNCSDSQGEKYALSKQIIHGFLQFETHAKIPRDLAPAARRALAELVHHAPRSGEKMVCFGLQPLEYDLGAYVDADINALAVSLPEPESSDLMLETSSRSLDRAVAALSVSRRLLTEGRPRPAAAALREAREAFGRIGHQIGLRRVAFLESVVFDGDLSAFHPSDTPGDKTPQKVKIVTAPRVEFSSPYRLKAGDWSRALRQGQADRIAAIFQSAQPPTTPQAAHARWAAALILSDGTEESLGRIGAEMTAADSPLPALCGEAPHGGSK